MNPEQFGARKLLMGVILMTVGVLVDSLSKNGLTSNLLDLLKYVGMGFFAGNSLEHLAGSIKGLKSGTDPVTAQKLDEIQASITTTQQALTVILQAIPNPPKKEQV